MPKSIVVQQFGGPDVLQLKDISVKAPGPLQLLVRQTFIGVNFIDTYQRSGLYNMPLPFVPGIEAAGVIEAVGENVKSFQPGDRIVYATAPSGAYTEKRILDGRYAIAIPDEIPDHIAVAALTKGLTAHMLLFRVTRIWKECPILVHAAAGGVGQILCQWAEHLGAIVMGTVSTPEKAKIAAENGCQYPLVTSELNFAEAAHHITEGKGAAIVYDSVGKDTFAQSLKALRDFGLMVSYGQSSGPVPPIDIFSLAARGLYLTRPNLHLYKKNRMEMILTAGEIFLLLAKGTLRVNIHKIYPLADAAQAHADLEARHTTGSLLLKI